MGVTVDNTGRTRTVRGELVIWRWLQFDRGAWTNTAGAASGRVTLDLNALDAEADARTTAGAGRQWFGGADPGEQFLTGNDDGPQWYAREYRIEFKFVQASGAWAALVDTLKGFVETVFSGELIFEANRNIERPSQNLSDPTLPAKFLEWDLEFPR